VVVSAIGSIGAVGSTGAVGSVGGLVPMLIGFTMLLTPLTASPKYSLFTAFSIDESPPLQ
jgi:hypothetical protein